MFCGVGPFSILIAKHSNPKEVYAIDINKTAIDFVERNMKRNKVDTVTAIWGDSKVLVPELESADRIIMNLPHSAFDFLGPALSNIKHEGIIHYYEVLDHNSIKSRLEDIENISGEQGIRVKLEGETEVHTYSPDTSLYCLDLKVQKEE